MRLNKFTGFIVYSFPLGEADQIVTSFTSAGNILKFVAKGSRKVKSRFAASVQLFNLGEYVVYCGKGLPYLRQADIIDSYSEIRRDWSKSGAAFSAMELCRLLIGEEAGEIEAFQDILAYMHHLKEHGYSSGTFDAFRLHFAASLGYQMSFNNCSICGLAAGSGSLNWSCGGFVCSRCQPALRGNIQINAAQLTLLDTLHNSDYSQADALVPAPVQKQSCADAVDSLIFWLTEGKTKAQAFRKLFEDGC